MNHITEPTVPCGLCGRATRMTGTKRCDRCYELERRIQDDPALARQILRTVSEKKAEALKQDLEDKWAAEGPDPQEEGAK